MVAGFHLIWTAYGWWLPNDPRGGSSPEIRAATVAELGDPHYGRKRTQPPGKEIRQFYVQAKDVVQHPLLNFSDDDIERIGMSFGQVIQERRYTCYGCAIMPDHVHLLVRKHRDRAEEMIETLQHASREALIRAGRRALTHPVWGGRGWKVFLYTRADMARIVRYIGENPIKARRAPQHWSFVKEYDGWLPTRY